MLPLGAGVLYKLRSYRLPVRSLLPEENQDIRALVDLIMPRDELSPGAVDLDVDVEILAEADKDRHLRRSLIKGVKWLNTQADSLGENRFLVLSKEEQILLIEKAETADFGTVGNQFFRRLCNLTFEHYYTKQEAWSGLCYPAPPQPLGFIDYQSPPKGCGSRG